ncbi:MAG: undecaprenyldiphospho-muramoylpentapeptide beta-N-acetylglucosaminyltransferase [Bacillota bacterium]|jgi:UDP-N-acetylglucosamine--N-acetylmuramyl-(pentapeptide) pyrophosphoryl-undecaprenol N-acetylglucosamine transferase
MKKIKIVVTGGGTGGHIYPALAIARGLQEAVAAEILYLGGHDSLEARLVPEVGITFKGVSTRPLRRKSLAVFNDLMVNKKGQREAQVILNDFQPHIAIGTGGYASWPVMNAAIKLGIPTLIHEQNVRPGLSNRVLAKKVTAICISFAESKDFFTVKQRDKISFTGLPVRAEILQMDRSNAYKFLDLSMDKPVFLITGGSQGSQKINDAMVDAWKELIKAGAQIVHLTGEKKYAKVQEKLCQQGLQDEKNLHLLSYLKRMDYGLAVSDLVLGRAGASFLAEILCLGIPSILAPFPFAAGNHQLLNAQVVEKSGGAIIIEDKDLTGRAICEAVLPLLADQQRLEKMSACASGLGKPEALDNIVDEVLEIVKNS